jgi:hydrogenase/urease accessory protein HupE
VKSNSLRLCPATRRSVAGIFLLPLPEIPAHLMVEGAGEMANGALHPLMTPAHMLVILSLGLLLGQRVPLDLKTPFRVFAPVSAAALLWTLGGRGGDVGQPLLIGIALVTAVLVTLEMKIPAWLRGLLCGAAAVAIGLDSAVDRGSTMSILKTLGGTWLSLNAAVFYLAACASNAEDRKWARVGIRVIGSWIIAISLMVLAFSLRKSS